MLLGGKPTTKSDGWSYVVMWEIVTAGNGNDIFLFVCFYSTMVLLFYEIRALSIPGNEDEEVKENVKNGYKMPQPDSCPDEVYKLMLDWYVEV